MHDLAAPARGLARDRLAALEHEHAAAAAREGGRAREADDPRPDDEDVDLGPSRGLRPRRGSDVRRSVQERGAAPRRAQHHREQEDQRGRARMKAQRTWVSGNTSCTPKSAARSTPRCGEKRELRDQERREQRLGRGEHQLLGLPPVEGQPVPAAAREPRTRSGSAPTSSVHWLTFEEISAPRPTARAPAHRANRIAIGELGRLRRQRRDPLHQQELVDAWLRPDVDQAVGERLRGHEDRVGREAEEHHRPEPAPEVPELLRDDRRPGRRSSTSWVSPRIAERT